jgi:5-methylcytosine-specific restriction endonuclease McrA
LADNHRRYLENQEENRARSLAWAKNNPEKKAAKYARREAQKRRLPDTLTIRQAVHLFTIGQAMYPDERLHLDHIVPLSKGGGTTLANMHAIPARLNCSKNDALPQEVYKQELMEV